MNNKIIKFLLIVGMIIFINIGLTTVSNAALSITTSKSTVSPGETFNVTVSVNSNEAGEATLSATNGSLSQNNVDLMSQSSITVTCVAGTSGTISISASGTIANYDTETEEKQNASKSVTINSPTPEPTPDPTPTKSSDTSLKSLSISPFGKINKASSGIYDITVENSLEKVTISAVPNHSNAKVTSGNGEFSLEEGTNNFKVVVKAEDGTEGTHKIRIIRKAAETTEPISPPNVIDENKEEEKPEEDKNDELGLTNLVVTGIELNPKFSADVYEYKAEFSEDIDTLEILATPNIEGATVEIVGNSNLKIGENLITIMVKSKDGETTKTYQIMVNKNEPEVVAPTAEDGNTAATSGNKDQELKSKIGKIILIAAAAVIAVILLGIIAIVNTKKKSNESVSPKAKKETFNKNDFRVAVNEEESYKELEKLSNIHNRKNIFENAESDETENQINDDKENISFEELSIDQNNQEIFEKEDVKKIDNVDDLFAKENSTDNVMKEVTLNVIPDTQTEISKSKKTKGKRFK